MNNSHSTPERSVKRTYAGRTKRKRDVTDDSKDDMLDESEYAGQNHGTTKAGKPLTPLKNPVFKPRSPKKVEGHLPGPGPSPKRSRRDMEDTTMKPPSSRASQSLHGHNSSSASSFHLDRMSSPKPLSSASLKHARSQSLKSIGSLKRPITPDMDDSASVADSSPGAVKVRRTEAERTQILKDDAACGEIEPHRAFCKRCDKWVNLGKQQTYALRPWEKHRTRCDQKHPQTVQTPPRKVTLGPAEDDDDDDNASIAASSIVQSERSVRRSEPERLAFLQSDPNAECIEVDKVMCKVCGKWVKLSTERTYALGNWISHQRRCSGAIPSSRVATAQRKLKLVNDPQAMSCNAHSVECSSCHDYISLGREGDYDLTKWNEHKIHCSSTSVSPSTGRSRPPVSVASTEATAVASDRSPPMQGRKRAREIKLEDDPRPSNRPRTENYEPIQKDAPGPWGWFLVPFHAFMRGFREGMGTSSSG